MLNISAQTTDWLRPRDVQRLLSIGNTKFWQLVKDQAFPISKPDPNGKLVYVKRSDVENFLVSGYPKAVLLDRHSKKNPGAVTSSYRGN